MTIREIRALTGLTQARFAEKYGIPRRNIEDWERGIYKPSSYLVNLLEFKVRADIEKESD